MMTVKSAFVDIPKGKAQVTIHVDHTKIIEPGSITDDIKYLRICGKTCIGKGVIGPSVTHLWLDDWDSSYVIPRTVVCLIIGNYDGSFLPNIFKIFINSKDAHKVNKDTFHYIYHDREELIPQELIDKSPCVPETYAQKVIEIFGKILTIIKMIKKPRVTRNRSSVVLALESGERILPGSFPPDIIKITIRRLDHHGLIPLDEGVIGPQVKELSVSSVELNIGSVIPSTVQHLLISDQDTIKTKLPDVRNIYLPEYSLQEIKLDKPYYQYSFEGVRKDKMKVRICNKSLLVVRKVP